MNTSQGTERINEGGATEIKVDTVNYRSPAGQDREAKKENVEVTHLDRKDDKPGIGGVMAKTAAILAEKFQKAKEAISGTHNQSTHTEKSK